MPDHSLLIDLHKRCGRQGPGGEAETLRAIQLAMLDPLAPLTIADIGCGTGAATVLLARTLNAHITAVDLLPEFIEILQAKAQCAGLADRIETLVCSMDSLPFADEAYDVIWSEGAIYNIGFANGVKAWRRFLRPGGTLVVSEITWLTADPPPQIRDYWEAQYPEIAPASAKLGVLEDNGHSPVAYFVLPEHCWLDNYYAPLQAGFADFLARHGNSDRAQALVQMEQEEIALYRRFKSCFSYGVYSARKLA